MLEHLNLLILALTALSNIIGGGPALLGDDLLLQVPPIPTPMPMPLSGGQSISTASGDPNMGGQIMQPQQPGYVVPQTGTAGPDAGSWVYDKVYDFFVPLNPFAVITIVAFILLGAYGIRVMVNRSPILPNQQGEYVFTIIRPNEQPFHARATVYPFDTPTSFDNIEELRGREETKSFAEAFETLSGKVRFYVLDYTGGAGYTHTKGLALLATNARLEDAHFYGQRGQYWDAVRAQYSALRIAKQASINGRIWEDAYTLMGKKVDVIWYPVDDPTADKNESQYAVELFGKIQASLHMAAEAHASLPLIKKDNYYKRGLIAANKSIRKLENDLHKAREEIKVYRRQWANKDYWPALLRAMSSGMSPMLVFLICGGTFLMAPEILARNTINAATGLPMYQQQQYNVMAIALAGAVVGIIYMLRGRDKTQ